MYRTQQLYIEKTSKMAKIWARKKPFYSRPSISKTSVHHYSLSWIVFECLRNLKTCPKTFIFMGRYKTKENYFDTNNKINYGSLKEKKWRFFREKKRLNYYLQHWDIDRPHVSQNICTNKQRYFFSNQIGKINQCWTMGRISG